MLVYPPATTPASRPRVNRHSTPRGQGGPTFSVPARGSETILLAEDDEQVRNLVKTVLEEYGYTVIAAVDGEDAVNKYRENKDKIQLLLFDLIMPKRTGKEAYDEIRKIRPDIKILYSSGYAPDIIRQRSLVDDLGIARVRDGDQQELVGPRQKLFPDVQKSANRARFRLARGAPHGHVGRGRRLHVRELM